MEEKLQRYKSLAQVYITNRLESPQDLKRHDRISGSEAKVMLEAKADGLTQLKIAQIFHRDPRSVRKVLDRGDQTSLIVSVLEVGKSGTNSKTGKPGKLVSFRLTNPSDSLVIMERIYLDVLSCKPYYVPPLIAGPIVTYKYDIELHLSDLDEYLIAESFKLAGPDTDKFEIFCTSEPGFAYQMRVKVCGTKHPHGKNFTTCSDPFHLIFHRTRHPIRGIQHGVDASQGLVGEDSTGDIKRLVKHRDDFIEGDNGELRLFLEHDLSSEVVHRIEQILLGLRIASRIPIQQSARILFIRFKYIDDALMTMAELDIPGVIGWQLFNFKAMESMEEFWRKTETSPSSNECKHDHELGRDLRLEE